MFTVVQSGGYAFKPFLRNTLFFDADYNHVAFATDALGTEITHLDRASVVNKTELGVSMKSGKTSFMGATYGEFADDHTTWGGRFGVKFELN